MVQELSVEEKVKKKKIVSNIRENYRQVERSIVNQLFMKHDLHGTTIGSERELIWAQLFEMIIPKKFVIEPSVFIIDSKGRVSHEVDFAILDETYTPYIFRYGKVKFVPIEAIAAVIECKSQHVNAEQIEKWSESIKKLKTSSQSVARMATFIAHDAVRAQKSTRPIRILCALDEDCSEQVKKHLDFTVLASKHSGPGGSEGIEINCHINKENVTLYDWYQELNFHQCDQDIVEEVANIPGADVLKEIDFSEYAVKDQGDTSISLLTFNFQLNQLLMLINNPILFPHRAYAKLFNYCGEEEQ